MGLSDDETLSVFLGIGLAENTAKQSLKNAKFARALLETVQEAGAAAGCDKAKGALLYMLASKCPHNALVHRTLVTEYVMTGKIASNAQLEGACDYLKGVGSEPYVVQDFEAASGVGVVVTAEEISAGVSKYVAAEKAALEEQRYHYNTNLLLGKVRGGLKWADMAAVKQEIDHQVQQLLGPKTEADMKPPEKKKKTKAEKKPAVKESASEGAAKEEEEAWRTADPYAFFPRPEQNNMVHTTVSFSDGRQMRISNSPAKLKQHLAATGGKVLTRFPPEPNGYLHIGHAKAMFVDFGMAEQYGGSCYLRFDDTNPEAEKKEYIDHIQDIVSWMGWKPFKVTYSSDYFQELYDFAVQLIRSGNAYVCHQTAEEIKQFRERREGSPWRDRPIEESLKLFDDMRRGLVDEGAATLRMKMDPKNENFNMFDLIAYRIKFTPHPHAGDTWCIYPSYDYTHCLVDALENITHSLCTLEFESRRASYYWLLEVLDTYKPLVWEYARLNITHTMLSKRKLNTLVTGGHVNGWDDPRLLTLAGLRRRGVRPQAINSFCREVGITRSEGEVPIHKLEHHIRMDLDATSPRTLAVLRPLRVVITNLPAAHLETVEAKAFPGRSDDTYKVPFSRIVYIEATDFREQDKKDFFGLAPGKTVMLRYAYAITCTSYSANAAGQVTEVQAEYHPDWLAQGNKPPKGVLNWVAQPTPGQDPESAEARLYDHLFSSPNPGELDNWLTDIHPASVQRLSGAFITPALASARAGDSFQFERLGYFCADADSRPGRLVFNRTATLRESTANKSAKK